MALPAFTFHYASTLSCFTPFRDAVLLYLHSTMLLLYRLNPPNSRRCEEFTFHYASTLSERVARIITGFSIYIPLCFYFISFGIDGNLKRSDIYIPLCFYFIPMRWNPALKSSPFTFHYASTLSDLAAEWAGIQTVFTFHYASTLSVSVGTLMSYITNLHSTMLLLYQDVGRGVSERQDIYIPLCFYFIHMINWNVTVQDLIYIPLCFYFI